MQSHLNSAQLQSGEVRLGVIGLPERWEAEIEPALKLLAGRVKVSAVYDAVANRGKSIADALACQCVQGVVALGRRADVDALLVLDSGWAGDRLLPLLATTGKPVCLATHPSMEMIEYLHSIVTLNGALWIPELSHRFTPACTRLMELLATQLGVPHRIEVAIPKCHRPWTAASLMRHIDWCFYLLRRAEKIQSARIDQDGCRVRFRMPNAGTAELFVSETREGVPQRRIRCARGDAKIDSDNVIRWKLTGQRQEIRETLEGERSATAVQLSIFLRRVAGGLIPTADLSHLHRSLVAANQLSSAWF